MMLRGNDLLEMNANEMKARQFPDTANELVAEVFVETRLTK